MGRALARRGNHCGGCKARSVGMHLIASGQTGKFRLASAFAGAQSGPAVRTRPSDPFLPPRRRAADFAARLRRLCSRQQVQIF